MDLAEEISKRKKLYGIIVELSKEKIMGDRISDLASKLEALYDNGFRHFYSDIPAILQEIRKSNRIGIEIILDNLNTIRENCLSATKQDSKDDFCKILNKLIDHIRLEFSRMQSAEEIADRLLDNEDKTKTLKEQLEQSQKNYENLQTKTDGIQKQFQTKTDGTQKQLVAVLGIFASIITVSSGGLSFTNATLSAIANANIPKLIAVSLTVGLVLIDVCYGLFYCLDHFMNSNDKSGNFKPLFVINIILLVVIISFTFSAPPDT